MDEDKPQTAPMKPQDTSKPYLDIILTPVLIIMSVCECMYNQMMHFSLIYCSYFKLSDGGAVLNSAPHSRRYPAGKKVQRSESNQTETRLCFRQTPPHVRNSRVTSNSTLGTASRRLRVNANASVRATP